MAGGPQARQDVLPYESPVEERPAALEPVVSEPLTPVRSMAILPTMAPAPARPALSRTTSFVGLSPPPPSSVPGAVLAGSRSFASGYQTPRTPPLESLDRLLEKGLPPSKNVGVLDRIACHQWTWFTMTMATGGLANVLYSVPFRSGWLTGIGVGFFVLNVVLFVMNCVLITMRFRLRPGSFVLSFTDQVESLFIPSFFTSLATIFINICQYALPASGKWLLDTMEVLFWVYVALASVASAGMYLILWSTQIFPIHTMTPLWVFPAYPLLLTAPFATNLIGAAASGNRHADINSTSIALCAVTTQGTGCLIAFMISAAFMYRLMTQKLPRDAQRPAVFISVGPFSFTVTGIVQLGNQAEIIIPKGLYPGGDHVVVVIVRVLSLMMGLWLWGLAMWWFMVSVGSLWKYVRRESRMPFQMGGWWSFVFPNTALATATEALGSSLQNRGLQIYGCAMAACLVVVWVGVLATMIDCLRKRKLLWPKED